MTDSEDVILRQNAEEVKQTAASLQEMKIYNAMQSGVRRGKQRAKRRRLFSGVGVTLAAAVVLLLFTFLKAPAEVTEYTVRSATPNKAWTDSKLFESAIIRNKSLASAMNQNLIQPVFQGAEKAGLRVEIMGTVSDGRQVFILYRVQNNTGETVIHAKFSLDFGKFEAADIGASLEMTGSDNNEIRAGETKCFVYSNNLAPETDYPSNVKYNVILTQISDKALSSSSNKYRTSLDVPFELNTGLLKDQNRTWIAKQDLAVGGQKLKVKQVLFTPLNTYVDVEVDALNSKQIFGLINPVLIGKSGDKIIKSYYPSILSADNSENYTDRSKFTLVYKGSSEYSQLDSLSLKTFGIAALDKNQMKIVVDLDKKKIIEAPDGLTLDDSVNTSGAGELGFWHKVKTDYAPESFIMSLADSYTDAEGKTHTNSPGNGAFIQSLTRGPSLEETYYYNFGAQANVLPQPLTIAVKRYWNPVMDTQSVELYSK